MVFKSKNRSVVADPTFHDLSVILFSMYLLLLFWVISLKCNERITITDTYYVFGDMTWEEKLSFAARSFSALLNPQRWESFLSGGRQDMLNIVVFVPLGIYLSYFINGYKLLGTAILSILLSFSFETPQLITHIGCFEAMDIVTNTLGGLIGYLFYRLIYGYNPIRLRVLKIISVIMLAVLVILICHAAVNTGGMIDFYMDVLYRRL